MTSATTSASARHRAYAYWNGGGGLAARWIHRQSESSKRGSNRFPEEVQRQYSSQACRGGIEVAEEAGK
ncbi:hypothetical protein HPP92_028950 [Vanilla planifolia]|uniref:Uncharacterized protein n=1 Tax=Vanilla planifolia TaxID=51239 RepID=A0A835P937_VANPL|nr:hypothetical protein HPP92_028940 [Vanilla planifolia]KAG0446247.1 hypothetical protein HPP92_028950 [Vanilla planifolia]